MRKNFQFPGNAFLRRFNAARRDAFTLIEIAIALGIIAFSLSAIFGLLWIAMQGTNGADFDERLTALERGITSTYQTQPFSTLLTGTAATSGTTWYDYHGIPMTSGTAITSGTYFQCAVKDVGPIGSGSNGRFLRIQISWPYPALTGTDTSVISILNYR